MMNFSSFTCYKHVRGKDSRINFLIASLLLIGKDFSIVENLLKLIENQCFSENIFGVYFTCYWNFICYVC